MDPITWPSILLNSGKHDDERHLSWIDYILFLSMLLTSLLVGIYFGFAKNKNLTTTEYFFGGKSTSIIPIAFSLIATQFSGTTIIAIPADIYKFGSNYILTLLSDAISFLIALFLFLPTFYNLQLVSIFEYLELRFNKKVRRLMSLLNAICMLLYCPVIIYLSALGFSQVAGVNIYVIVITVSATCIIYTTLGGFKAVIWTDVLQFLMMMVSMITILAIGVNSVGGVRKIFSIGTEYDRFDFLNFRVDVTSRNTVWAPLIGTLFLDISLLSINQSCIQKYLSLPKYTSIKRCLLIHFLGYVTIQVVTFLTGTVIFAKYVDCNIFKSQRITKMDQLVPYFVMEITKNVPGLPGLFIAGIFSATLSSLSSALNSTAATIYKDLVLPFISSNATQQTKTKIIKLTVVILGFACISLVFVVQNVEGVYPFATALRGIIDGPMLGVFILGLLFPVANSKGALTGAISGLIFTGWIVLGNAWYRTHNLLIDEEHPTFTEKCYSNQTSVANVDQNIFILYRLCFWYYTAISTVTVVAIGYVVSWFTREGDTTSNRKLVSSVTHNLLPKEQELSLKLSE